MDLRKKTLLHRHREDITKDLEVNDIIDQLLSTNAITAEDAEIILNLSNRQEKAKQLLDIIENRSDEAYQGFLDCLEKDYNWLWSLLSKEPHYDINTSIEDSLSKGDVPRLPNYYVRRPLLEKKVLRYLEKLSRHKALVLLGTIGSGKTTIAASVLRNNPDLISNNFNGRVFWLNCSNCKNEIDITALQNKLHRKTITANPTAYNMHSSMSIPSISSIGDTSISGYERSWEDMRDVLKEVFSSPVLSEALLVLDEVNERWCVDAFDVGCKILVTTREKSVYGNLEAEVISIENKLGDSEILDLFANCLGIRVRELPRQAKKLQEACKGKSPFYLALIGAQLADKRESLTDAGTSWKQIINNIQNNTLFSIFNTEKQEKPEKVMKFVMNSLENDIFNLFKMLPILPDNIKVSASVLSKLWRRNVTEVESILRNLKNKSLINEFYDKDQKMYLYETHEIILDYLKGCSSEDEKHKWHSNFLKSYQYDNPTETTVEIVDDGYIAFFIGYHLENTYNVDNNYSMFHRLFLDLKFLGNKVRLTGQADVIYDLQKYENHIVAHALDKDLLNSIVAFLKTYGTDLYRYQCTDIVQSILQHESKGILYKKAYDVAQENVADNELYFDFSHEHNVEEIIPSTIDVKETITSCCFQYDYVLIGTQLGNVKIFYLHSNKLKGEILAARCPIKWIGACPNKPSKVAILSADGDIHLWTIKEEDTCTIEEESEDHQSTPSLNSSIQINPSMRPCLNARWAESDAVLLTHTSKTIALNNTDGQLIQHVDVDRTDDVICCSIFNEKFIVAAVNNVGGYSVVLIDNMTQSKVMVIEETDRIINLVVVPGTNKIITLKEKEVMQHKLKIYSAYQNKYIYKSEKVICSDDIKDKLKFLSMAVNKSGTLLFVSTCDERVKCVDLNTNRAFDIENRRGNVITMDVSEIPADDDFLPGMDVLLTGTGTVENTAKVWFLDASFVSLKRQQIDNVRLTKRFDVSFTNSLSPVSVCSATLDPNSNASTPRRNQSFAERTEPVKKPAAKAISLDRFSLKPLSLKGACNNNEGVQPLLAVVDDTNNIQVLRGRKLLTKIPTNADDQVNVVRISPCNQYIIFGLRSGHVNKFTVRTKDCKLIMDLTSPIQYLNFVDSHLLIVSGENRCIMAYKMSNDGEWESKMLQQGSCHLGSTEMLNDIQGVKKKNGHSLSEKKNGHTRSDSFSETGSTSALACDTSTLVDCFWLPEAGLITVEISSIIKLWDRNLKLESVLNAPLSRKEGATCAACKKSMLVICRNTMSFQVFQIVKEGDKLRLNSKCHQRLTNAITCCDLTADGSKLALGMESGTIEIWNVSQRTRITVLRHHKAEVTSCAFSPVPDRLYRTSLMRSPLINTSPPQFNGTSDEPPLVLMTMATEIVWWNVSFILKQPVNRNTNVLSPLLSPADNRIDSAVPASINNNTISQNVFFGNGNLHAHDCWKSLWKHKRCKKGSKRQEILACIKLSGMNAKKISHNEDFSCFVTVDNSGHVHIMNVMRPNT